MSEPFDREIEVFNAALELPAAECAAYLDQACAGDPALRQRVEGLLKAIGKASTFLESPGAGPPGPGGTVRLPFVPAEKPGNRIGRYKLLQQIGEGGCGVVYMAEQEEPVRRRVALKVIKLGMDTKEVIARFEAERQALALMDHPNIAKVLDAGATDKGRPYFVMELVRGIKITDYCDQNRLSTGERLKLFVQVCNAIQHAHQKGIIHRDIKPSNILVTLHDGMPVPKVIDFGIAKATQGRLTDQTLFTAFEQFIGTPAYMSPEQAEMSGLDIDTRCDIYALGVLLYELLTGQTPFDAGELLASGLDKMRQTIREQEPERPSTRLGTMINADLTSTASRRQIDAPKLVHLLRGDIDWIVMKALEKDRTRRYETASGLAKDIQRHLCNEPVEARPPGGFYRLQKLVRRNKLAFAAGGAVMTALVLGLGLSTALFLQERQARHRADAAEKAQALLRQHAEERSELGQRLGLSALYLTQGKYEEAEKEIGPMPIAGLTNYVATAFLFNAFADVHARRGEWAAVLSNLSKVMAVVPSDFPAYASHAVVCVQTGDRENWQRDVGLILGRFGQTRDPIIAGHAAQACLILPPAPAQLDDVCKMVDTAVIVESPHKSWAGVCFIKALGEYRLGHHDEAVKWLKKIDPEQGEWNRRAAIQSLLAMAQFQTGQTAEAQATLKNAIKTSGRTMKKVSEGLDRDWNDWIIAHSLMDQAQALIQNSADAKAAKHE